MSMYEIDSAYVRRCQKRLQEWGAPLSGWYCDYIYDVADEEETDGKQGVSMDEQQKAKAVKIIEGLGGFGNIGVVNNCLTRLRVDIKDMALVDEDILKKTGAMGFVRSSDTHIQVIYGPKVERIASDVREVLKY